VVLAEARDTLVLEALELERQTKDLTVALSLRLPQVVAVEQVPLEIMPAEMLVVLVVLALRLRLPDLALHALAVAVAVLAILRRLPLAVQAVAVMVVITPTGAELKTEL
jgi:hypothetical protein